MSDVHKLIVYPRTRTVVSLRRGFELVETKTFVNEGFDSPIEFFFDHEPGISLTVNSGQIPTPEEVAEREAYESRRVEAKPIVKEFLANLSALCESHGVDIDWNYDGIDAICNGVGFGFSNNDGKYEID